jgi:hypothetical protein
MRAFVASRLETSTSRSINWLGAQFGHGGAPVVLDAPNEIGGRAGEQMLLVFAKKPRPLTIVRDDHDLFAHRSVDALL